MQSLFQLMLRLWLHHEVAHSYSAWMRTMGLGAGTLDSAHVDVQKQTILQAEQFVCCILPIYFVKYRYVRYLTAR